jgi:hypothetical protein
MSKVNLSEVPLDSQQKIAVLCHDGETEIVNDRPDVVEITPEHTLAYAAGVNGPMLGLLVGNAAFMRMFRCVFRDYPLGERPLGEEPIAVRHVVGLICLVAHTVGSGATPFVRLPETYLHPKQQLGLADLFLTVSNFFDNIRKGAA